MRSTVALGGPLRSTSIYWPLFSVVVAGCIVRIVVMLTYSTSVFLFQNGDSIRYARIPLAGASTGLFSDIASPAGYPLFLAFLREISAAMPLTVVVQHCVGIGTALLLYAAARRFGAPKGAAAIPAAVVLLSGDQIFLEHVLLTESLWAFLISAGLYTLVRANAARRTHEGWLIACGVALAAATTVREVSAPLVIVAAFWAAVVLHQGVVRRLRAGLVVIGSAMVAILIYAGIAHLGNGNTGLVKLRGFQLYGRVAQFADCTKFTPPAGTRVLCQQIPPAERPGPQYYLYADSSPLRRHVKRRFSDALLGTFARRAILHQPRAYVGAVVEEFRRIVGLGHARIGDGADPSTMRFDLKVPFGSVAATPQKVAAVYDSTYSSIRVLPRPHWAHRLGRYQAFLRLHELFVIPLILLALLGAFVARGSIRAGIMLFLAAAVLLYVAPPMAALWDVRYGILPGELLTVAAASGGWAITQHRELLPRRFRRSDGLRRGRSTRRASCRSGRCSPDGAPDGAVPTAGRRDRWVSRPRPR